MSKTSDRLRELLHQKNIKQKELSQMTGISEANICHYISGKYPPKQENVEKMAKILNVSPIYLQGWEDYIDETLDHIVNSDSDFAERLTGLLESYDEFEGYKFTGEDIINIMDYIRFMIVKKK